MNVNGYAEDYLPSALRLLLGKIEAPLVPPYNSLSTPGQPNGGWHFVLVER